MSLASTCVCTPTLSPKTLPELEFSSLFILAVERTIDVLTFAVGEIIGWSLTEKSAKSDLTIGVDKLLIDFGTTILFPDKITVGVGNTNSFAPYFIFQPETTTSFAPSFLISIEPSGNTVPNVISGETTVTSTCFVTTGFG